MARRVVVLAAAASLASVASIACETHQCDTSTVVYGGSDRESAGALGSSVADDRRRGDDLVEQPGRGAVARLPRQPYVRLHVSAAVRVRAADGAPAALGQPRRSPVPSSISGAAEPRRSSRTTCRTKTASTEASPITNSDVRASTDLDLEVGTPAGRRSARCRSSAPKRGPTRRPMTRRPLTRLTDAATTE